MYWIIVGQQDNLRNLGRMARTLREFGIDKKYIINGNIGYYSGWIANMHFCKENKIDYFSTGISYSEVGLNIECLAEYGKGVNLSVSSQDLAAGYRTAEYVFSYQKNIKFVLIGLSPYSFTYDMQKTFSTQGAAWQYKFFFKEYNKDIDILPLLLKDEYIKQVSDETNVSSEYINLNNEITKANTGYEFWLKGFLDIEHELRDVTPKFDVDVIKYNKKILTDYIDLCHNNGAEAIAVVYPFAPIVQQKYPKDKLNSFYMMLDDFKKYKGLQIINLFELQLKYNCFYNATHLNVVGSNTVSKIINNTLPQYLYKSIDEWKMRFEKEVYNCNVKNIADILIKNYDFILKHHTDKNDLAINYVCLILAAMQYLNEGKVSLARECAIIYRRYCAVVPKPPIFWNEFYLILGKIEYTAENYELASSYLDEYGKHCNDYEYFLLKGNIFLLTGNIISAEKCYKHVLQIWPNYALAVEKLQMIESIKHGINIISKSEFMIKEPKMAKLTEETYQDIPIFINSRDRFGPFKRLVEWLLSSGYRNIIVLDNDSTYGPLLEYYTYLDTLDNVKVIRIGKNLGHTAIYQGFLNKIPNDCPFVYTDSDVVPKESCPADLLWRYYKLLIKYPYIDKIGLGLVWDDLPTPNKYESDYYHAPLEKDVYLAAVDTTFALYRPIRSYRLFSSIRTSGDMMAYHVPWYYTPDNLPEDEKYYSIHANSSSFMAKEVRTWLENI